jgi:hypothetical protein
MRVDRIFNRAAAHGAAEHGVHGEDRSPRICSSFLDQVTVLVVPSRAALRRFPFAHRNRNLASKFGFVKPLCSANREIALPKHLETRDLKKD